MNDLCVFTCEYSMPPTDAEFLRASCERVGITLHSFGLGKQWPGYTDRLRDGAEFLRNRPEKYALFLDSADTFICNSPGIIVAKFEAHNAPFLFSAETNCWPDNSLAHQFPDGGTKYNYLNAGAWIGERKWIIDHMQRVWETYHDRWAEDDTRCLVQAWLDGMLEGAKIDHNCTIFHSHYGYRDGDLEDQACNTLTGTWPSCFHFNGRSGLNGIREEWYGRAMSRVL